MRIVLLSVCLVLSCSCSGSQDSSFDQRYSPKKNFVLSLGGFVGLREGFLFVIQANREFVILEFLVRDRTSRVLTGQLSTEKFTQLMNSIRETGLLDTSQKPLRALPETLIYTVNLMNGSDCKSLRFLPKDSRFESFVESVRSIMERGTKLEENDELRRLREVLDLGIKGSDVWVGYVLMYKRSPKAHSLLRKLIESKKVDPSFGVYLRDENGK